MNILFIGDIFGRPGRDIVKSVVPKLRDKYAIDFCIANAENAAAGKGLTPDLAKDLFAAQVDVLTGGNHIWHKKELIPIMDSESRLIRPLNLPQGAPGYGSGIFTIQEKYNIAVVQLVGRVFFILCRLPISDN